VAGTLQAGLANLPNFASSVIVNDGTLAFVQTGGGIYNGTIRGVGNVTINLGVNGGDFTFAGTNSYGGGTTISSGNTKLIGTSSNLSGFITTGANTNSSVQFNQTFDGTSYATIAGTGSFIKEGAGTLTLINSSTYTGATNIRNGVLAFNAINQLGAGTSIAIENQAVLRLVNDRFAEVASAVDLGSRGIAIGTGGAVIDVTSFNDGYVTPTANVLTVGGVVTGAAVEGLTKNGGGTLVLSNATNSYAGATLVNGGTLQLGNSEVLPNSTNVTIGAAGTLDLSGRSETIAGLNGSGSVNNTASGNSVLTVGSGNANGTFSGSIGNTGSGTTGFVKTGAGTQTLSGSSTYSGATDVQGGTLLVSGSISGNTNVNVAGSATLTANGTLSAGTFDVQASGLLNGTGALSGDVTIRNGGKLAPGADLDGLAINSGSLTFEGGSTFQLSLANSQGAGQPHVSDYSKLTLGGDVSATLGGNLALSISGGLNSLDLFTIIINGGEGEVGGLFSNITDHVSGSTYSFTSNGIQFLINYAFDADAYTGTEASFQSVTGGTDVALLVVPEPNAMAMLACGFGLAVGLQRFRRNHRRSSRA
jgi:autotransporter-associated beta strand protein